MFRSAEPWLPEFRAMLHALSSPLSFAGSAILFSYAHVTNTRYLSVRLEYPRQPIVVVNALEGRHEFVPMECVHVVEDKKLLFVSVLAARQATSPAIAAVYRVDFDEV